jgi:hypothetical protein
MNKTQVFIIEYWKRKYVSFESLGYYTYVEFLKLHKYTILKFLHAIYVNPFFLRIIYFGDVSVIPDYRTAD